MSNNSLRYHSCLGNYFSGKSLYLDEEFRKKTNNRKLVEQPWQQTKTAIIDTKKDLWDLVIETLCDLYFIKAKSNAGLIFELIEDFNSALNYLPEYLPVRAVERKITGRLDSWTNEIIEYSRKCSENSTLLEHGLIMTYEEPQLPKPPRSCRMWTQQEIESECRRIIETPTRCDILKSFMEFIISQCYSLIQYGVHTGFIFQHAYNVEPDGSVHNVAKKILSTVNTSHFLRLWPANACTNPMPALLQTLEGHTGMVSCVCITPNGKGAISGSENELIVWDLVKGECRQILNNDTGKVNCVSMTPDGKRAVSGSWDYSPKEKRYLGSSEDSDYSIRVWDLENWKCLCKLIGHENNVYSVCITPDGKSAASSSGEYTLSDSSASYSGDNSVRIWDLESKKCIDMLKWFTNSVTSVSLTPNGKRIISGSKENTIHMWDKGGAKNQFRNILEGHNGYISNLSMTPDGQIALSGSLDKTLRVWDLKNWTCLKKMEGHIYGVLGVSLTPDGLRAVSSSDDRTLRVWDTDSGQCLRILEGHTNSVNSVSMTPDGRRAISAGWDKTVRLWNLENGQSLQSLMRHIGLVRCLKVTPDGRHVVSAGWDTVIKVWDLMSGECLRSLEGHTDEINCIEVTIDGLIVSASDDSTLKVWDFNSGQCLRTLFGHSNCVKTVISTPNEHCIISGSTDKSLRVWDTETGECIWILEGHTDSIYTICTAIDGRCIVSGSWDRTLRVWDIENGQCQCVMRGHTHWIENVIISKDGRRVISGSWDKTLRMWDIETGQCLLVLREMSSTVLCLTPDEKFVIAGSQGQALLRVWNLESGQCLHILAGHTNNINSLSIMPDGLHVISASDDKTLRMWNLESGRCNAIFLAPAPIKSVALSPLLNSVICGTTTGEVIILNLKNIDSKSQIP